MQVKIPIQAASSLELRQNYTNEILTAYRSNELIKNVHAETKRLKKHLKAKYFGLSISEQ